MVIALVEWPEDALLAGLECDADKSNTGTCLTFISGLCFMLVALFPEPRAI